MRRLFLSGCATLLALQSAHATPGVDPAVTACQEVYPPNLLTCTLIQATTATTSAMAAIGDISRICGCPNSTITNVPPTTPSLENHSATPAFASRNACASGSGPNNVGIGIGPPNASGRRAPGFCQRARAACAATYGSTGGECTEESRDRAASRFLSQPTRDQAMARAVATFNALKPSLVSSCCNVEALPAGSCKRQVCTNEMNRLSMQMYRIDSIPDTTAKMFAKVPGGIGPHARCLNGDARGVFSRLGADGSYLPPGIFISEGAIINGFNRSLFESLVMHESAHVCGNNWDVAETACAGKSTAAEAPAIGAGNVANLQATVKINNDSCSAQTVRNRRNVERALGSATAGCLEGVLNAHTPATVNAFGLPIANPNTCKAEYMEEVFASMLYKNRWTDLGHWMFECRDAVLNGEDAHHAPSRVYLECLLNDSAVRTQLCGS